MRSPSLDAFYSTIEKNILLVQGYTEIKELSFIIRSCRLKPLDMLSKKDNNKFTLYKKWIDEFGNSLIITKQKRIKIIYNDLLIDNNLVNCTDLYYGLSMERTAKISKLFYLAAGRDKETHANYYLASFLGIDNYLRTFLCQEGVWQPASPLLIGLRNLKNLSNSQDIKYFRDTSNKENIPFPCFSNRAWITFLPTSRDFLSLIDKQYGTVFDFLKENKE